MANPIRFTVYSRDANIIKSGTASRPREFQWNLNIPITSVKYSKIAVESVFCRNIRANITTHKAGTILNYEITNAGVIEYDPTEPVVF